MAGDALDPASLLASLNEGVYATDKDRRIVYWSPTAERITGWSADEIVGKSCSDDVLNHVDKDGHRLCGHEHCPLYRAMVTGHGSDVPVIVFARGKKGKLIPMRVSVAPVRDETGRVVGGVETFQDVSEEHYDVEMTRDVQLKMLHRKLPADDRIKFATHYIPLGMTGGDYYAITQIDGDRVAFMLADVSGHGSAAALYTVYLNAIWDNHVDLLDRPAELGRVISADLLSIIGDDERIATAIIGLIDLEKMKANLAFAGGPPPFLFQADGTRQRLEGSGFPLGGVAEPEYAEKTVSLNRGDCLLFFTDGMIEVTDVNGWMLGGEGLARILKDSGYPESRDFDAIEERLLKFSDRIRFNDDLTLLEIRIA